MLQKLSILFEDALIKEIEQHAVIKHFEKNELIIDINETISHIPITLEGNIKIMREDDEGNELLLYYMEALESCVVTLKCCTTKHKSEVRAITEDTVTLLFIPVEYMEKWMIQYHTWRNFILDNYSKRFNDMLEAVDTLAFMNVEERIIKYLEQKSEVMKSSKIQGTHLEIATELNSSRVVISRILKKLEHEGRLKQSRNEIEWLG